MMQFVKTKWSWAFGLGVLLAAGCGSAGGQKLDETYMKDAEQNGKIRYEIMQRANGDWASLNAADREAYVKTFNGDEAQAKSFWENIKGGPPGPGPR
jgi:hypothetical protein